MHEQRKYVDNFFTSNKKQGIDIVQMYDYILSNTTNSTIRDCLKSQLASNQSIFHCWYSYHHLNLRPQGSFMRKSINLGLKCPFTTYHHSCGGTFPQMYDCLCEDNIDALNSHLSNENDQCVMLHYSTDNNKYTFNNYLSALTRQQSQKNLKGAITQNDVLRLVEHHHKHIESSFKMNLHHSGH